MATISDVAKRANVSKMTVSRVLNSPDIVKDETREAVLAIIKELNYSPNMMAKGLATKRSHTIAHVIASISNPYHPKVVQGVEDACYEFGYNVILCNANAKEKEKEYIQVLKNKMVDGIIFHHLNISVRQAMELENEGIKCIYIDNEKPLRNLTNMTLDQTDGAYMATKHLIDYGHKKIGIIHGALGYNANVGKYVYEHDFQFEIWNHRLEGYLKAMSDHGLDVNPKYMIEADGGANRGFMSGKMAIENLIGGKDGLQDFLNGPHRPTAIYGQNDQMAIGAINGAMECGCRVPDDLSIIGQDGLDIGETLFPQLTTIEQPRYDVGYQAAKKIIDMLDGDEDRSTIRIDSKLVVRQSTMSIH